jgi:hypothetical protein
VVRLPDADQQVAPADRQAEPLLDASQAWSDFSWLESGTPPAGLRRFVRAAARADHSAAMLSHHAE